METKSSTIPYVSGTYERDGFYIVETHNMVRARVFYGLNFMKDIKNSFRNFFGGRSATIEKAVVDAEAEALGKLLAQASEYNANAMHRVWLETNIISMNGGSLMVGCIASATPITVARIPE